MSISAVLLVLFFTVGLGCLPTGLLVARLVGGVDIRRQGSGNIGATNIYRVLGWQWAVVVFLGDMVKGLLPAALAWALDFPAYFYMGAGVAAVAVHIFNPVLRGRGGKGVATSFGVMLIISPSAALVSLGVWAGFMFWKRLVSLASLTAAAVLPVGVALFTWNRLYFWSAVVSSVLLSGLVVFAHRENLKRLWRGEETPPRRIRKTPE